MANVNEGAHAEPWDNVKKRLIDKRFVSCVEDYEIDDIIADLKEVYKNTRTADDIENAVLNCCDNRGEKIGRDFFLTYVADKLK